MILKILSSNYKIAIEFSSYLNVTECFIWNDGLCLHYKLGSRIFSPFCMEEASEFKEISFCTKKLSEKSIVFIDDFFKLREYAKNYKFIAVEPQLRSVFFDWGQVECLKYSESKEGRRWLKLFELAQFPVELNDLRSMEVFKSYKDHSHCFFSYLNVFLNFKNKKDLYVQYFCEEPSYVPEKLDDKFFQLYYVDVILKDNLMVDPALIPYIEEDVLYVGCEVHEQACNQVIYSPQFMGYSEFVDMSFSDVKANDYYEEKYLSKGLASKVIARRLKLYSNEPNFYGDYKKYVKNLLNRIVLQREVFNWEDDFKIDSQFFSLLEKTKNILMNFQKLILDRSLDLVQNGVFQDLRYDFCDYKQGVFVDIVISQVIADYVYFKKKYMPCEYYVVNADNFTLIEFKEMKNYKKIESVLEDDLFSWVNLYF